MRTATVWCKALPSKSVAETIQYILYSSGQSLELQKKKNHDSIESAVMKLSKKEKEIEKEKGGELGRQFSKSSACLTNMRTRA